MDHSENDKRFCVYVHKDQEGNVRYVGSGTIKRCTNKSYRSEEHLALWDSLEKEIITSGLSKEDALLREQLLLDYFGIENMLNKQSKASPTKPILFSYVSEYICYDESSPTCLRWRIDFKSGKFNRKAGDVAGCRSSKYFAVNLFGNNYKAHRVVWVLSNKSDLVSNLVIDHIDGDKLNNRIGNLRLVTRRENNINIPLSKNNTSGCTGVYLYERGYLVKWNIDFKQESKFFNFRFFKNKDITYNTACEYRNIIEKVIYEGCTDSGVVERKSQIENILLNNTPFKRNTSGVNGVSWNTKSSSWIYKWQGSAKREHKRFSVKKLFPDLPFEEAKKRAFELAVEFRNNKVKELAYNAA